MDACDINLSSSIKMYMLENIEPDLKQLKIQILPLEMHTEITLQILFMLLLTKEITSLL